MPTPSNSHKHPRKKIELAIEVETPEEHVHESVDRQKEAAKNVRRTAATLKRDAADKANVLALATNALSDRVGTLAEVVTINNKKIDLLQAEVNRKPDDVEVQFIAGMADTHRRALRNSTLGAGVLSAVVAGLVAFAMADYKAAEKCQTNSENIKAIVNLLESLPDAKRFQVTIDALKSNRNDC